MLTMQAQLFLLDVQREVSFPIADVVYHVFDVAEERIGLIGRVCAGAAPRPIAGLVHESGRAYLSSEERQ